MEENHAKLTRLFKTGSLKTVADELLEADIITRDVQTNPAVIILLTVSYLVLSSKMNYKRLRNIARNSSMLFMKYVVHMLMQLTGSRKLYNIHSCRDKLS